MNGGISVENPQVITHSEREDWSSLPMPDLAPIIALAYLGSVVIIS